MVNERTKEYYDLKKRNDVRESAKRLRRKFLRYKDAENEEAAIRNLFTSHFSFTVQ